MRAIKVDVTKYQKYSFPVDFKHPQSGLYPKGTIVYAKKGFYDGTMDIINSKAGMTSIPTAQLVLASDDAIVTQTLKPDNRIEFYKNSVLVSPAIQAPATAPIAASTPEETGPKEEAATGNKSATNAALKADPIKATNEILGFMGKMADTIWIPYALIGIGMATGTYFAWKKGKGYMGYAGLVTLGSLAGLLASAPVAIKSVRMKADSLSKKLDNKTAS